MKRLVSLFSAFSLLALMSACTPTPVPGGDDKNDQTEGGSKPLGELTLTVDEPVIRADGQSAATFTVMVGETVVTEGVQFYDGNDKPVELTDMKFTTTVPGVYTFWVSYKTKFSDKVEVMAMSAMVPVIPTDPKLESSDFHRRSLLIQFTGTGCGYCPLMVNTIRRLASDTSYADKFVHTACHTYNDTDPAYIQTNLTGAMGVGAYPSCIFNLDKTTLFQTNTSDAAIKDYLDKKYDEGARVGVAGACVTDGSQLVLRAGIKAGKAGSYRLAAWVLEDGIVGKQQNYMAKDEFGMGFDVHDNCIRAIYGQNASKDFTGQTFNLEAGETGDMFVIFNMPSYWVQENLHVVVFASAQDGTTYTVNNCIDIPVNSSAAFSYKE